MEENHEVDETCETGAMVPEELLGHLCHSLSFDEIFVSPRSKHKKCSKKPEVKCIVDDNTRALQVQLVELSGCKSLLEFRTEVKPEFFCKRGFYLFALDKDDIEHPVGVFTRSKQKETNVGYFEVWSLENKIKIPVEEISWVGKTISAKLLYHQTW